MKKTAKTLLLAALLTTGASAQENAPPSRTDLAYAAGYKAQFICSGLFNGGKSLKDITADELTGIYDFIAGIVPTLDAEIDNESRARAARQCQLALAVSRACLRQRPAI